MDELASSFKDQFKPYKSREEKALLGMAAPGGLPQLENSTPQSTPAPGSAQTVVYPQLHTTNNSLPPTGKEQGLFVDPETPAQPGSGTGFTTEQGNAVLRIKECKEEEWYDILGVSDQCSREEAHEAYKKLVILVHPDKNKHPEAKYAFDKVKKAAESLKAGDDYKGEENGGPDGTRPTPQSIPEPTDFQKGIYDKATEFILAIIQNPDDSKAIAKLDALNGEIRGENTKEKRRENDGLIQYRQHITHRMMFAPYIGKETEEAIIAFWKIIRTLDMVNQANHYPRVWNLRSVDGFPKDLPEDHNAGTSLLMSGPGPAGSGPAGPGPAGSGPGGSGPAGSGPAGSGPAGSGPAGLGPAGSGPAGLGPAGSGPAGSGPAGSGPGGPGLAGPSSQYTTDKGFPVRGVRKAGGHGYLFVVENGKDWKTDNFLDLKRGSDLGKPWSKRFVEKIKNEWSKWDIANSKKTVTEDDGNNYKYIKGIASNPVRTKKINSGPRYPTAHALSVFEKPTSNGTLQYEKILDRTALNDILGQGKADDEIKEFYTARNITPPWEIAPLVMTSGKPRAIDSVTSQKTISTPAAAAPVTATTAGAAPAPALVTSVPATAPAPVTSVPAVSVAGVPQANPGPQASSDQLRLTNKVEGMEEQLAEMTKLLQQLLNTKAPQPHAQAATSKEFVMAGT